MSSNPWSCKSATDLVDMQAKTWSVDKTCNTMTKSRGLYICWKRHMSQDSAKDTWVYICRNKCQGIGSNNAVTGQINLDFLQWF